MEAHCQTHPENGSQTTNKILPLKVALKKWKQINRANKRMYLCYYNTPLADIMFVWLLGWPSRACIQWCTQYHIRTQYIYFSSWSGMEKQEDKRALNHANYTATVVVAVATSPWKQFNTYSLKSLSSKPSSPTINLTVQRKDVFCWPSRSFDLLYLLTTLVKRNCFRKCNWVSSSSSIPALCESWKKSQKVVSWRCFCE